MSPESSAPGSYCGHCGRAIAPESRFCPHCGAHQDGSPQARPPDTDRPVRQWRAIRSVIVFYILYLSSIIPLFWMKGVERAKAFLIVCGIDVAIILGYWLISRASLRGLFAYAKKTRQGMFWALVALMPLFLVNLGYHRLLNDLMGQKVEKLQQTLFSSGYEVLLVILFLAVFPAVWEEIAFRGLVQTRLARVFSRKEALYITAFLFAVIHIDFVSWPYLFLLGIVLGELRTRFESLWPCMLLHFLHNGFVLLANLN